MKTAPPDDSKHRVLNVIDGDTIVILTATGELKVRVIGIDTPETVHPGEPVEPGGPEATDRAEQLLAGKTITIHYDANPDHGKWGKYGRLLAYLELPDGRDYGLVMIRERFSKAYIKYPFSRQSAYLVADLQTNFTCPFLETTMEKSKEKQPTKHKTSPPKSKPTGWGIDPEKYAAARQKK